MARKVFLSVLGASFYGKCKYEKNDTEREFLSSETRFIQTATIEFIHKKIQAWGDCDQVYILLTDKAKKTNWKVENNRRKNYEGVDEDYKGLKDCLMNLSFLNNNNINELPIKDGKNEKEIWGIFNELYSIIKDEDELYIDITHAFRYIPMFMMVFCNYVKFMRKCTIRCISYGNYETRYIEDNIDIAPIIDITSFSDLQDWTAAVRDFKTNGKVDLLNGLHLPQSTHRLTISKKQKGVKDENILKYIEQTQSENTKKLKSFIENTQDIVKQLNTCQGKYLIEAKAFKTHKESLDIIKEIEKPEPFNDIIKEIEKSFEDFHSEENIKNGILASQWCYNNGLYQQSVTLLQETLITLVCNTINIDWRIHGHRDLAASAMQIKKNKLEENEKDWHLSIKAQEIKNGKNIINEILKLDIVEKLYIIYGDLTDIRNEFNHAAMLETLQYPYKKIDETIKEKLNTITTLLNQ